VGTKPQELTFPSTIAKEAINELPLSRYDGPIGLVSTPGEMKVAVAELRKEKILGFDTETRPSFRRGKNYPPALLQLGGADKVFLFQLLKFDDISPALEILADPGIVKVGVAIRDDVRKLRERQDFKPAGFIELADITHKLDIVNTGLRSLAAIFLNVRISKGAQVSNWSREHLSDAQTVYAATDAWISREIYMRLIELGLDKTDVDHQSAD
jgi:ribonuclease D